MLPRRLKLLGKILLALVVLFVVFLLFERFRGQIALAKYKKALRTHGEKISPQDFAPAFRAEDNGAPAVFAAIKRLTNGAVLPDSHPPRMKVLESGRAIVGFREPEWVEKNPYRDGKSLTGIFTNHWADLAADWQTNATPLAEIQTALTKPVLNNQLNLAEGNKLKFDHLGAVKNLTHWFGSASQLALHESRTADAAKLLGSEINLLRLLAEDNIVISELVRIAIGSIARGDTWEALQSDGWTDADLATLQQAWESQEFATNLARSLTGERVFGIVSAEYTFASNEETYQMIFNLYVNFAAAFAGVGINELSPENHSYGSVMQVFLRKQVYCRVWRFAWAQQSEVNEMENIQNVIGFARQVAQERSYNVVSNTIASFNTKSLRQGIYDRVRFLAPSAFGSLSGTIMKAAKMETDKSLTLCAIALKRYSLRHGQLPENLTALVPAILTAVPIDYMDGKPIKYRLNPDGSFTLYSVGEDGKDDGGDATLLDDKKATRSLWARKDFVWPAPATLEEIEEYRREASKH